MCDYFLQRLEGDQAGGGDLTDIVRAGGAMPGNSDGDLPSTAAEWQMQPADQPMLFPQPPPPSSDGFGDPFAGLGDPFSSDYSSGSGNFLDGMPDAMAKVRFDSGMSSCGGGRGGEQMLDMGRKPLLPRGMQQMMPGNIGGGMGARLMQSPLSPIAIRPYPAMAAGDMMKLGITAGQAAGCAIDAAVAGMQMSSPRNSGGIKRRKNQARKVVCIPAPTTAGSRPTGEVVPSDLWAWRKYGQKPIKGSPHPRGYYRCSSSKGCSARKQVERSRTDPSMLVITYTSEHNHPWPTQRNALAGSTRSHHGKNGGSGSASGSKSSHNEKQPQPNNVKEEKKDHQTAKTTTATSTITTTASNSPMIVKEESLALARSSDQASARDKRSMDTAAGAELQVDHSELVDHVFSECYRPMMPESGHHEDFFADFADLTELESDPMSLIFSKEYMEARPSGIGDHGQKAAVAKELEPFDMLDWSTSSPEFCCREASSTAGTTSTAGSTFEQGKRS